MRHPHFSHSNQIELLAGGGEFFPQLVSDIDAAQHEVYLETYIFQYDEVGRTVAAALERAARRGLRVYLIVDWVGTTSADLDWLARTLPEAGVHLHCFNPWFRHSISRTHRKLCAVDKRIAYVGGININDDYLADHDASIRLPAPRWDFAVRIIGPLVASVARSLHVQWARSGKIGWRSRIELLKPRRVRSAASEGQTAVQPMRAALVERDNLFNRRSIQKAYLQALGHARHSIVFANPYFAPGRKLRHALEQAARRGVRVRLLLGVGQFPLQDAVARSFYPRLIEAGVEVIEYRHTQLHGKVAVVDDDWATVGSSNYDGLSMFVNQEANVVILDAAFARQLRDQIEQAMSLGVPADPNAYQRAPWYRRIAYFCAFTLYVTVIRVVTWSRYT